jgi:hypothetical protein
VTLPYDPPMAREGDSPPRDELIALAQHLIALAGAAGVRLRAMGGVGVGMRAPHADPALQRSYADVDLAAPRKARRELEDALTGAGLTPEREFNALHGSRRQIWWTADGTLHVDVFLGEFAMCHRLDLEPGLAGSGPALAAADLLLTKLQVVELNLKDAQDAAALLTTHELAGEEREEAISLPRLRDVLAADWGFYTTVTDNLERIPDVIGAHAPAVADAGALGARCGEIVADLDAAEKSRAFRMRAKLGRRKRWYDVPEETL